MGVKDLSLKPQKIDDCTWYYEEKKGLEIIFKLQGQPGIHISIPWRMVLKSVDRYKKEPAK